MHTASNVTHPEPDCHSMQRWNYLPNCWWEFEPWAGQHLRRTWPTGTWLPASATSRRVVRSCVCLLSQQSSGGDFPAKLLRQGERGWRKDFSMNIIQTQLFFVIPNSLWSFPKPGASFILFYFTFFFFSREIVVPQLAAAAAAYVSSGNKTVYVGGNSQGIACKKRW